MKKKNPPVFLFGSLVLIAVLHFFIPFPWNLSGAVLIIMGSWMNISADSLFKKRATTVKLYEEPENMIRDGVYRFTRNPMYAGMTGILLGICLLSGPVSTLMVPVIFAVIMDRVFIRAEEENMKKVFGDEFEEYRKNTRRWI